MELVLADNRENQRTTPLAESVRPYLTLTKPGITLFIALTAAAGFVLAAGGIVTPGLFLHTVLATALSSAGAAALNQIRERDADARMRRTARRPLPSGALPRAHAAAFAVGLTATGLTYAAMTLPWLSALLIAVSHASYVLAYTPLKRVSPLCTLVGAVPGALPLLAGWTASGAAVDPSAVALTGVVYLWQIPHFLSIGWLCREDYARAGFRVLSVVDPTGTATGRLSLLYALVLVPVSLVPSITGLLGTGYAAGAALLGAAYAVLSYALARRPSTAAARRLFFASLLYLPAILAVAVVSRFVA